MTMDLKSRRGALCSRALLEDVLLSRAGCREEEVQWDAPLGLLTWYKTGGHVQALVRPASMARLFALLAELRAFDIPWRVIGSGANLLIPEGIVPGVVLQLDHEAFRQIEIDADTGFVEAGAGCDLMRTIRLTTGAGLAGLEGLAGVPASLGGAVAMNAGGRYGEVSDCLTEVLVCNEAGETRWLSRAACGFIYRGNAIEEPLVLAVRFRLTPHSDKKPLLGRMKKIYQEKTATQPFSGRSAGCSWKNPPKDVVSSDGVWRPAGKLVDEAGLKGYHHGTAEISPVHANFITLARINGRAEDVLHVLKHAEETVLREFGIQLVREVVVW